MIKHELMKKILSIKLDRIIGLILILPALVTNGYLLIGTFITLEPQLAKDAFILSGLTAIAGAYLIKNSNTKKDEENK